MNKELIFFRLAILVALTSLLGFGVYSEYCSNEAAKSRQSYIELSKIYYERIEECANENEYDSYGNRKGNFTDLGLCHKSKLKELEEWVDSPAKTMQDFSAKANFFFHLSYFVPITSIFLFYGGRWIILGKLRPLIPKR